MWLFAVVVMVLKVLLLCYKYGIYIYIYIYLFYCFRSVNGLFEMNGFQNSFPKLFTSSDNCSTSGTPGWWAENNINSREKTDLGNDF